MSVLLEPLRALLNMVTSLINGLIVGSLHFILNLLDGLDDVEATHINLNDQTLEGLRHKTLPIMSVQYHPEAAAGPHDGRYLFERFHEMMKAALA